MNNFNKIKAVLFDMDGTLVDTEPVGPTTISNFLKDHNIDLSSSDWDLFDKVWRRDGVVVSFEEFFVDVFKRYLGISDVSQFITDFYNAYEKNILRAKSLPGANESLIYLKNRYRLALVTASTTSQAQAVLKNNNWENIFDLIISHDDYKKSKPDPESFLQAAKLLKILPQECIVIEDSKNGVLAAKNAGMFVIGVRAGNKNSQDLSAANMVVDTLIEIKEIF